MPADLRLEVAGNKKMAFKVCPVAIMRTFSSEQEEKMAGGFLKKKAGGKADKAFRVMNKGKWQRRWFIITEITGQENYELLFLPPDDATPRATLAWRQCL